MAFVMRLHTLIDNTADPEFVGSINCVANDSYTQS
jgi:hypothetical protein